MEKVKYILVDEEGKPFTNEDGSFVTNEGFVHDEPPVTDKVNQEVESITKSPIDEAMILKAFEALVKAEKKLDEQNKILEQSIKKVDVVPPIIKKENSEIYDKKNYSSYGLNLQTMKITTYKGEKE